MQAHFRRSKNLAWVSLKILCPIGTTVDNYYRSLMYFGLVNNGYGVSFFTPTILNQLGPTWTPVRSQIMSIPIYVVATILALITAFVTDRLKHRFAFIILGCCIAVVGYGILLNMTNVSVGVRYAALYLIAGGGEFSPALLQFYNHH